LVSSTIRTAPSRNSRSYFFRFSGISILIVDASTLRGNLTLMLDMRVIFVDIPPGMVPVGLEEKEASDADIRGVCDPVSGAGWSSGGSARAAAAG
jgi:hypothetical protein